MAEIGYPLLKELVACAVDASVVAAKKVLEMNGVIDIKSLKCIIVLRAFLHRPIRDVLNSGILSVCPSVRGVAVKRCVLTIDSSCHIDGRINDLDFYVIPMLYHRDSSDFFAKP